MTGGELKAGEGGRWQVKLLNFLKLMVVWLFRTAKRDGRRRIGEQERRMDLSEDGEGGGAGV